jgi:intracellular multiplication protein IcmD
MFKLNLKSVLVLAFMAAILVVEPAFAQSSDGVGGVADNVKEQFGSLAQLIFGAMFLVGIGLGGMAALKFKAHSDNPQQNKLMTPVILALVAAMLIALPTFINTSMATLWGGDAESGGLEGDGAGLIDG